MLGAAPALRDGPQDGGGGHARVGLDVGVAGVEAQQDHVQALGVQLVQEALGLAGVRLVEVVPQRGQVAGPVVEAVREDERPGELGVPAAQVDGGPAGREAALVRLVGGEFPLVVRVPGRLAGRLQPHPEPRLLRQLGGQVRLLLRGERLAALLREAFYVDPGFLGHGAASDVSLCVSSI
jgi:hypothetical protein